MPRRLAFAFALSACFAVDAAPALPAGAPIPQAWVQASNAHTRLVMDAQAKFSPEDASSAGLAQYDGLVADMGPKVDERYVAAMLAVRASIERRNAAETDARVRQDLAIVLVALDNEIAATRLEAKLLMRWTDVPRLVFSSLQELRQEQMPAARRAKALERLQRYAGLIAGTTPLTEQARARFTESAAKPGVRGPVKARVERSLVSVPTYMQGIRDVFKGVEGAEPALAALAKQFNEYAAWERREVLPLAREDFRLPPELYAMRLKQSGIDIDPQQLIQRAQAEFMSTRAALQTLAPLMAQKMNMPGGDYRAVIRAMKRNTVPNDQLEARYKEVNKQLEALIRRERVVDVPKRAMIMRLASDAESAAQAAPHMQPPPLVNNTGEYGQFILPVSNPSGDGKHEAYDDFNFPGAMWTVSAHEGRPGHELQFTAMVERGVSTARSLYAMNSVNVEGWALYAEAEMLPFEPVEGQIIALQLRLLRAARAMLDPMLNLGLITREEAGRVLLNDVVVSAPMARQELDRYTFNAPGQAGSYFYGYSRLLQLRAETELALGAKFDQLAFNNFLLDQGLLPLDLLAKAVREEFVPAQKATAVSMPGGR
jgi:uncharacterized protein (DUF885 family)